MEEDGGRVEAWLAVDHPSEDRLIFVDRYGRNLGEYTRTQVADLIAAATCEIVDTGNSEKDSFEAVIRSLMDRKGLVTS